VKKQDSIEEKGNPKPVGKYNIKSLQKNKGDSDPPLYRVCTVGLPPLERRKEYYVHRFKGIDATLDTSSIYNI